MRFSNPGVRDRILKEARAMTPKEINMRSIAGACDIALGTLYNYFSSKEDILMTLTEEYWQQQLSGLSIQGEDYHDALKQLYNTLASAYTEKGQLLMCSLKGRGEESLKRMAAMQNKLEGLVRKILPESKRDLSEFVTDNIVLSIERRKEDIDILLSLI